MPRIYKPGKVSVCKDVQPKFYTTLQNKKESERLQNPVLKFVALPFPLARLALRTHTHRSPSSCPAATLAKRSLSSSKQMTATKSVLTATPSSQASTATQEK